MKIIHTGDWHLGQNFYNYDREDEHRLFFSTLAGIMEEHRPDALLVCGDVFHNAAPSAAAWRLFVEGVIRLHDASPQTTIVITAGNHDSGSRLEAERQLWQRLGIYVNGGGMRNSDGTFDPGLYTVVIPGKGYVLAVPHFHPSNYPLASPDTDREHRQMNFFNHLLRSVTDTDAKLPVVLMAHLAVDGCNTRGHEDEPVGGMLKDDLSLLGEGYDYLALGHIHMPQRISPKVWYSGSALPVSFSEDYPHSVNLVEIDARGDTPRVTRIEIPQLRRVKTVPPEGAPLDRALEAFADIADDDDSYVRILVDQDDIIDADAEDRARKIAEGKACRFCEIRHKPRRQRSSQADELKIRDMSDFKDIDPLSIARISYERINNVPMSDTLADMMARAIKLVEEEDQP